MSSLFSHWREQVQLAHRLVDAAPAPELPKTDALCQAIWKGGVSLTPEQRAEIEEITKHQRRVHREKVAYLLATQD
ncbi:MAG: hypothetical protein V4697_02515 [Patescibacteria group bacterium]